MPRRDPPKLDDLRPGDIVRGTVHECENCGAWFVARADARMCSNACRLAAKRKAPLSSVG